MSMVIVGIVLISVGLILTILAILTRDDGSVERKTEGGGFVIIGPFPIIFGTNKRIVKVLYIVAIIIIVISLIIYFV
ncbi:MAG: DUF131 domain-containing protein [Nitrososphaerota archaeon]|nr:DUF131 domain-containing protein [Nitrososphaerota archaeon]MDG7047608.1 DUF131 domain-containing protein [Nitrososphaerota archaeon]